MEKWVAKNDEHPYFGDEGFMILNAIYDVDDGHVLLAKCDDDGDCVFDCRDKSLFTRVMACEHEMVTLPSGEEVLIEAIGEVHLKLHL